MVNSCIIFRLFKLVSPPSTTARDRFIPCIPALHVFRSYYATGTDTKESNNSDKWFTLPPFTPTVNGAAFGKEIYHNRARIRSGVTTNASSTSTTTTALKWVLRCCPDLPRSLVQKLFRLRQVPSCPRLHFQDFFRFWHSQYLNKTNCDHRMLQ